MFLYCIAESSLSDRMEKAFFLFSVLFFLSCTPLEGRNISSCASKAKSKASLDLAKTSLSIVKELYPNCSDDHIASNSTICGTKQKSLGYLEVAMNLINYAIDNYPICIDEIEDDNKTKIDRPIDCSQILEKGHNVSGVYSIWLKNGTQEGRRLEVFCDMETAGGGWTVIQRRGDFPQQEDFFRNWVDYKNGFGNVSKDFWLGNDNLFALSNQAAYSIHFDLEDSKGNKGYAVYQNFKIDDESSKYTLHISNYSGNVGDAMKTHNNMKFSTKDKGHDASSNVGFCTKNWKGGWWYENCYQANLNGIYRKGNTNDYSTVNWLPWRNNSCLTTTEIKLKRI